MFFRIKTYIKFILKSTNQHGVHSPFVYDLVTQCFYDSNRKKAYLHIKSLYKRNTIDMNYKSARLLNRLIPFLGYKQVLIIENSSNFIGRIASVDNTVSIYNALEKQQKFDLLYLDINQYKSNPSVLESLFSKVHNDSLFLINSIHKSMENMRIWHQLKTHPKTTVTIETCELGFVFFRKEQAKEDFVIRI